MLVAVGVRHLVTKHPDDAIAVRHRLARDAELEHAVLGAREPCGRFVDVEMRYWHDVAVVVPGGYLEWRLRQGRSAEEAA